jgi:hypothetical protein
MANNNEMMIHQFIEEEAVGAANEEENMSVLMALLKLQAEEDAAPILGGSSVGRKKSKPRQRLEGHVMLYNDYFADDPTYNAKDFCR